MATDKVASLLASRRTMTCSNFIQTEMAGNWIEGTMNSSFLKIFLQPMTCLIAAVSFTHCQQVAVACKLLSWQHGPSTNGLYEGHLDRLLYLGLSVESLLDIKSDLTTKSKDLIDEFAHTRSRRCSPKGKTHVPLNMCSVIQRLVFVWLVAQHLLLVVNINCTFTFISSGCSVVF